MVVVVRIFDEDVDLGEADRDSDADASRAIGDRQLAVLLRDGRRLEDADGADVGGKRGVRHFAGLDVSGIEGILLEAAGIDATQFHLFSPDFFDFSFLASAISASPAALRPVSLRSPTVITKASPRVGVRRARSCAISAILCVAPARLFSP
jgi:hypothetical protein